VILWSTEKNVPSYKKQGFEQTNETKTSGPGCILTKMILNVQLRQDSVPVEKRVRGQ